MRKIKFHNPAFFCCTVNRTHRLVTLLCLIAFSPISHAQVTKADETPQERAQALTAEAVELFNLGEFDTSLSKLEKSLSIAEDVHETHYWLGRIYATSAGSSPVAKQQAVTHFRRALEIQPYGEDGELARGWLSRFDGRPKRVAIFPVQNPILKSFDNQSTNAVVSMLISSANAAGLPAMVTKDGPINLTADSTDQLIEMVRNKEGDIDVGWVIGIAVESVEGTKSKAKAWIFDPLGKQLYEPMPFSTSFQWPTIKSKDAVTTGDITLDDLSTKIWMRCRPIVDSVLSPAILDEVQFATTIRGIYARSAASYKESQKLPLIMLASVRCDDDDDDVTGREITTNFQQALLSPKQISLISSGNTRQILRQLDIDSTKALASDWTRAGQAVQCQFVVVPTLSRFEVKAKTTPFIPVTTIKVTAELKIKIIECASGKEISTKNYEKSTSVTKLGSGLSTLLTKRAEILNVIIQQAANESQQIVSHHTGLTQDN